MDSFLSDMNLSSVSFKDGVSLSNLFGSWDQFKKGKSKSKGIQSFHRFLEDYIFQLHDELLHENYVHGPYRKFFVFDPKKREISKASVKDRLVHHAVYTKLVQIFDPLFIQHSYSCRIGKGTHKGVQSLQKIARKVSKNGTQPCHILKMDILRFFDHIDHNLLKTCIQRRIKDQKTLDLTFKIIDSFYFQKRGENFVGIPLGNVTSQIFANIYLHELDLFVKHTLKKPYLRFCDDFLILASNRKELEHDLLKVREFLKSELFLTLHPKKISFRKLTQGIDFLGYVVFLNHIILRTKTKNRLKKRLEKGLFDFLHQKISQETFDQKLQSYLGILSHAQEKTLSMALKNNYWVR